MRTKKPEKMALINPYNEDSKRGQGQRLISVKENREWTFDDLALASGFSRRSLIRWMRGQARPNRKNRRKLQRFLSWYKI